MHSNKDPGLGSKFSNPVNRIMNPDGSYNINRIGGIHGLKDFYTYLLDISWISFLLILLAFYLGVNALFAVLYMSIGLDQLLGVSSDLPPFWAAFFFSTQTSTTLGFGGVHPVGFGANLLASFEAFVGLLFIALSTGLLYGRFSKPSAKIAFSDHILLSQAQGEPAVMFKMVNQRNNVLLKTKVNCIAILDKGSDINRYEKEYHRLKLELDFVLFFPLTWTVVHKIDEKSPFYKTNIQELKKRNCEIVIFLETFDETFGQEIIQKHSYGADQWLEKVKFDLNFHSNPNGKIDLKINELNKTVPL
ncbi:MAG: ion channel [Crocinitomicaceae bacterium]|jgi:inward rectifier potassium channel|nr:ion channel [Crocinitomicaceae bacterium]